MSAMQQLQDQRFEWPHSVPFGIYDYDELEIVLDILSSFSNALYQELHEMGLIYRGHNYVADNTHYVLDEAIERMNRLVWYLS
jgi:hypothetical protein